MTLKLLRLQIQKFEETSAINILQIGMDDRVMFWINGLRRSLSKYTNKGQPMIFEPRPDNLGANTRVHDHDFGPKTPFIEVSPASDTPMFYSRIISSSVIIIANYNPDEIVPITRLKVIKHAIEKEKKELETKQKVITTLVDQYNQMQIYVQRLDAILLNESFFSYIPRDITKIVRGYLEL